MSLFYSLALLFFLSMEKLTSFFSLLLYVISKNLTLRNEYVWTTALLHRSLYRSDREIDTAKENCRFSYFHSFLFFFFFNFNAYISTFVALYRFGLAKKWKGFACLSSSSTTDSRYVRDAKTYVSNSDFILCASVSFSSIVVVIEF